MKRTIRKAVSLFGISMALLAISTTSLAQGDGNNGQQGDDKPPVPVGYEVRSTNTPGGGGKPETVGTVEGQKTEFALMEDCPTTAGSAIVNVVITYYANAEDLAKAKALRDKAKKDAADAKKKKEEEKKKKKEDDKKKKGGGDKKTPPPDVPTFDPRFYHIDENGKVVPNDKVQPGTIDPHQWCEKPAKFECGEHYQWWLKNHEHRTEMPKSFFDIPGYDAPSKRIIMTGTVVAGQPAQVAVVDNKGAVCAGQVIALPDGSTVKTNDKGIATVIVPLTLTALTLSLADSGSSSSTSAWVNHSPTNELGEIMNPNSGAGLPFIENGPMLAGEGQMIEIPVPTNPECNYQAKFDGKDYASLSQSPDSIVVQMPPKIDAGSHAISIWDGNKLVGIHFVEVAKLQVEPPKTMAIGQNATYNVRVIGTDRAVKLAVLNGSPTVVSMTGAASDGMIESCGGKNNIAKIDVKALSPGTIQMPVKLFGL